MSSDQIPFSQRDDEEVLTLLEVAEIPKVSPNTYAGFVRTQRLASKHAL